MLIQYGHLPSTTNPNDDFPVVWRELARLCPFWPAGSVDQASALALASVVSNRESSGNPASLGRGLARRCERAALATNFCGAPYVSLVLVAADLDASPLLLLSDLAQHSRNIAFDPRFSLLLDGTEGHADRLDGPRLTLLGRAEKETEPRLLSRFTARHPSSAAYAGFADFRIYRLVIERGHLVVGFGRIEWIDAAALLFAEDSAPLAAAEPAIFGGFEPFSRGRDRDLRA